MSKSVEIGQGESSVRVKKPLWGSSAFVFRVVAALKLGEKEYLMQPRTTEQPNHTGHLYDLNWGNTSQIGGPENAPLSDGAPTTVIIPPSVIEGVHEIEGHAIDIPGTHPVEGSIEGPDAGTGAAAGHVRLLVDNPSNFHGDNFSGIIGNSDGIFHKGIEGLFLLPMGMIAEVGPGMIQVAGSTEKESLKLLLLCIDISATVCFLSCCVGLLGLVMRLLDCDSIPRPFLKKGQKVSYIAASGSMMISMLLLLAYIPAALYW